MLFRSGGGAIGAALREGRSAAKAEPAEIASAIAATEKPIFFIIMPRVCKIKIFRSVFFFYSNSKYARCNSSQKAISRVVQSMKDVKI